MPLLPRNDTSASGTVAVIIFIAGACILVLLVILVLLFIKKRRAGKPATFIPRLERRGPNYGKLEDDEEGAWSADMSGRDRDGREEIKGYAPVHDEGMGYQSQTMRHGEAREGYR